MARLLGVTMGAREGLLKAEFRDWYPRLVPGVWYKAAWLAAEVLEQQRVWGPRWEVTDRILSGDHFLFRGGRSTRSGRLTRAGDAHQGSRPAPDAGAGTTDTDSDRV
jgi:hypothetical protein